MKYCVTWSPTFRHLKEVDEIIYNGWTGQDTLLPSFEDRINKEKQKIILNLNWAWTDEDEEKAIIYINKAQKEGYNIAVQIPEDRELVHKLREANIPYMFYKYAGSLDRAYTQAMMGVSDIYVTEDLGFRIKDLQYIREQFGVKFRIIPNIAQIGGFTKEIDPMLKFWVRPEDTEIYEPYVDVFELWGTSDRLSVVYEIYKDRRWFGDLNDIILDFDCDTVPNGSMPPHIGPQRLNCKHYCLLGKCNLCPQLAKTARKMEEVGIEILKDKYKPEKTKEEKEALIKQFKERIDELKSSEESV